MRAWYYSKRLNRHFSKRLDFLIYAHDGRGLGHASRSIAIGMALRRLLPNCKTLFVSGCKQSSGLIGPAPLDWIKLPSYETIVVQGRSEGADGNSKFYKSVLGQLRTEMLAAIAKIFRPRLVLVDHAPPGKREELHLALEETKNTDTRWVLGLRAIIGQDKDLWSEHSAQVFKQYYHSILWYGDTNVLGHDLPRAIADHFHIKPLETGYVSRLKEIKHLLPVEKEPLAGTISIPWTSETTRPLMQNIYAALAKLGDKYGRWRIFVAKEDKADIGELCKDLSNCTVEEVSERYVPSLLNSKVAMIYGGYNSLTDILAAQIPAVVLLRGIEDSEQEDHLNQLVSLTKGSIRVHPESNTEGASLQTALEKQLHAPAEHLQEINLDGAEIAAKLLAEGVVCED